jgi:hypothetical protein
MKMAVGNATSLSDQLSTFENSSKYSLYLMITIAAYLGHVLLLYRFSSHFSFYPPVLRIYFVLHERL